MQQRGYLGITESMFRLLRLDCAKIGEQNQKFGAILHYAIMEHNTFFLTKIAQAIATATTLMNERVTRNR